MNKYKKRYQKIVKKLVEKSFPELKNVKIRICESDHNKFKSASADAYYYVLFWKIRLGKRVRKFPKKYIIAILAHELCHISIFQKRNFIKKIIFFYFILFLRKYREAEERNTELLEIQKGYGKELYSFRKYALLIADKKARERIKKYYLSPKQIKQEMKKLK